MNLKKLAHLLSVASRALPGPPPSIKQEDDHLLIGGAVLMSIHVQQLEGIGGRKVNRYSYSVGALYWHSATRNEPAAEDIRHVGTFEHVHEAIAAALLEPLKEEISNALQADAEAEEAEEMRR